MTRTPKKKVFQGHLGPQSDPEVKKTFIVLRILQKDTCPDLYDHIYIFKCIFVGDW